MLIALVACSFRKMVSKYRVDANSSHQMGFSAQADDRKKPWRNPNFLLTLINVDGARL